MGTEIELPEYEDLGPAMRALNARQRKFVIAMVQPTGNGDLNYREAARAAGYSGDDETLRVTGHRLAHSDKILAAMQEEGVRRLGAAIPVATTELVKMTQDPTLKPSDRQKAIAMILNRAGLPERSEHHVVTERVVSQQEKIEGIIRMAQALGLDPKALLGQAGVKVPSLPEPIEAEVVATTEGLEDLL